MKLLYLVRHAKAISQKSGVNDFKRSLSKQGLEDAQAMGKRLKKKGIVPDLLLSSPADRALETAHFFAHELGYPVQKILLKDEFYDDNEGIILEMLKSLSDNDDSLMLFGHEPTLSQLAALFLQETDLELRTSDVAGIALKIASWQELAEAVGTLVFFDFPVKVTPEAYKKARKTLAEEITANMENILGRIDRDASKHLGKVLEKTGKQLAKQLTKVLHASKVEDIAKVRAGQRIDTLKEFERNTADEAAPETGNQPQEAVEQDVETSEQSAPVTQSPTVKTVETENAGEQKIQTEKNAPDAAVRKTSTPKSAPTRRSTRRKRSTPATSKNPPTATRQQKVEENVPAPKTTTRRRSTRRKMVETKTSPVTRRRRTKTPTPDSGEPTSNEQN